MLYSMSWLRATCDGQGSLAHAPWVLSDILLSGVLLTGGALAMFRMFSGKLTHWR